jgi:hypothetical protein
VLIKRIGAQGKGEELLLRVKRGRYSPRSGRSNVKWAKVEEHCISRKKIVEVVGSAKVEKG